MKIERRCRFEYHIPKEGKMRVDAMFYTSEEILEYLEAEGHASLRQLENVATLPGVVETTLAMPDVHWGSSFPIGGGGVRPGGRGRG